MGLGAAEHTLAMLPSCIFLIHVPAQDVLLVREDLQSLLHLCIRAQGSVMAASKILSRSSAGTRSSVMPLEETWIPLQQICNVFWVISESPEKSGAELVIRFSLQVATDHFGNPLPEQTGPAR